MKREVDQDEILDLAVCAEDYGHGNGVCMCTLYEWAHPVSDEDIKRYSKSLDDGYEEEDRDSVIITLTEWRDKHRSHLEARLESTNEGDKK